MAKLFGPPPTPQILHNNQSGRCKRSTSRQWRWDPNPLISAVVVMISFSEAIPGSWRPIWHTHRLFQLHQRARNCSDDDWSGVGGRWADCQTETCWQEQGWWWRWSPDLSAKGEKKKPQTKQKTWCIFMFGFSRASINLSATLKSHISSFLLLINARVE